MMADKAMIESGQCKRCEEPGATRWLGKDCAMQLSIAMHGPLKLSWLEEALVSSFMAFGRLLRISCDAANAAAPYFIHIVRANRADDIVGSCTGTGQAGRREKQTVAGL